MRARVDEAELQTFHTRLNSIHKPHKRRASSVAASRAPSQMLLGSAQSQLLLGSQPSKWLLGARASAELPSGDASGGEEGKDRKAPNQEGGQHKGAEIESKLSGHLKQVASATSAPSRWRVTCELEPSDSEQPQQQEGCKEVPEDDNQRHRHRSGLGSATPAPGLATLGKSEHVSPPPHLGQQHNSTRPVTVQGHRAPLLPPLPLFKPPKGHSHTAMHQRQLPQQQEPQQKSHTPM
eukprot:1160361-Pelagomonas_calceolata.AAC.1